MRLSRRSVLAGLAAACAPPVVRTGVVRTGVARAGSGPRIVILGGGFGGASLARALRRTAPEIAVTLIESRKVIWTCPFSNGVLGGLWDMDRIAFPLERLAAAGVEVIQAKATAVEPDSKAVVLADGTRIAGDILVLAPGVRFDWTAIEGLSPDTAELLPHAWEAGSQTRILRDQLTAMEDGGLVVVGIPAPPFRCPPGPYERICLIAHYLKAQKPRSKILVLDGQDGFSKQPLFEEAWAALYPGMIERVPGSQMGAVLSVNAADRRISTGFDEVTADVANIIPPQKAASLLTEAGLDDGLGWCPVDPVSFESRLAPGVYVLGDAALQGDMPKSAFSANVQAKACAAALIARLRGEAPRPAKLINVCYSLAAPNYGFSVADVFAPEPDKMTLLMAEGRTTALGAPAATHAAEARYAHSWFDTITSELWG